TERRLCLRARARRHRATPPCRRGRGPGGDRRRRQGAERGRARGGRGPIPPHRRRQGQGRCAAAGGARQARRAMNISEPFIRRPTGTSLLMAGILVFGLASYELLPVSALPTVDFPTITVSAKLPGASPDTMAASVATPLEQQFAAIPGLAQMTSTSGLGTTTITLQFDLNRNIDDAAGDVQTAINAARGLLPKALPSPPTDK